MKPSPVSEATKTLAAQLSSLEKERDEPKAELEQYIRNGTKTIEEAEAERDEAHERRRAWELNARNCSEVWAREKAKAADLEAKLSASEAKLDVFKVYLANADKRCDALAVKLDASEAREKGLRVLLLRARDGSGTHAFDCRTLNSISDKCDCNADQNLCDEINAALAFPSLGEAKGKVDWEAEGREPVYCRDCNDQVTHLDPPLCANCVCGPGLDKPAIPEPVKEPEERTYVFTVSQLDAAINAAERTWLGPHRDQQWVRDFKNKLADLARAEPVKEEVRPIYTAKDVEAIAELAVAAHRAKTFTKSQIVAALRWPLCMNKHSIELFFEALEGPHNSSKGEGS